MPNNVVPRLQKIENNIKTVISIYEVVNNNNKNDKFDKSKREETSPLHQVGPQKQPEGLELFRKPQTRPGSPEASLLDSVEKPDDILTRTSEGVFTCNSMLESNKWKLKKPGSAPSSFSALSNNTYESNFIWQTSISPAKKLLEKITLGKAKTSADLNALNQSDSRSFVASELPMTPSKTLETANRILKKNNYKSNEDDAEDIEPVSYVEPKKMEDFSSSKAHDDLTLDAPINDAPKETSIPDLEKIKKELKNQDVITMKNRLAFSRKKNSFQSEMPDWLMSIRPKFLANTTPSVNTKKDTKSSSSPVPMRNKSPEKLIRPDIGNPEGKHKTKINIAQEKVNKFEKCKTDQSDWTTKNDEDINSDISFLKEVESKMLEKTNLKAKQEKLNTDGVNEKIIIKEPEEKKAQHPSQAIGTPDNQTQEEDKHDDEELWITEFSKIIEKSNEKLEKMKVSKELALDIARHLKDKYEGIQQSKQDLLEKLKKTENENERLKNEVKEANEDKLLWQINFRELKKGYESRPTELDVETKHILEENIWLKTRVSELQKQFTDELLERQKEIDRLQVERREEMKQEINNRKNRADVLRLTSENSRLLSKTETLQRSVNESHLQIKIQEEKIRQFEEEVRKQKQHLKEKTERLEETNRELELIRKNYNELEEQVKALRKSFENFDEMQQNLMKQILEYEHLMKNKQEQMKKLQEENSTLKKDLENEKDALLIKIKIIEDQQATIKQLREKSEEAKSLLKRNQSLERVINIEREEKLELQEAVERLKWRKEELKKKIKSLENDLFLAPQEVVRDLQKTQIVLHELENQVQKKQKEWEIQMQSLIKEKEQACSVAEFATKKLMQTNNEFQKQSEAHKKLRRLLAEKEKAIHETNGKATNVPPTKILLHEIPNNIVSGRSKDPTLQNFRLRQ